MVPILSTTIYGHALLAHYQANLSRIEAEIELARLRVGVETMKLGMAKPTPAKCPCCGSRAFRAHNSVMTCTYCRSAA